MKNLSYYVEADAIPDEMNSGSLASDAAPLLVNCAGAFDTKFAFTTDNEKGRLDYYLMHITKGRLCLKMPRGTEMASAGDTVLFPPGYKYRYSYDGEGEGLSYLWVHFTGSHADFYLRETGFDEMPVIRRSGVGGGVTVAFHEMFDAFSQRKRLYIHTLAGALIKLLTSLASGDIGENPLSRSLSFINTSYTEDIRIPSLAALDNLSNSRYHTLFSAITGKSPKKYITDLRIRHACELLRTTDLSVKQIGVTVGYPDPHFFCKMFKKTVGVSPSDYRE